MFKVLTVILCSIFFAFGNSQSAGASSVKPADYQWKIKKPAGKALQGYTLKPSVEAGKIITFYIHNEKPFFIEFYRMGYNAGVGSVYMTKTKTFPGKPQNKQPLSEAVQANWIPSVTFTVPPSWRSGVYVAKIVDTSKRESYIPFVIKQSTPKAQLGILISTNTYQAYNNWGGKSVYGYNSTNKMAGYHLSYSRPYNSDNGAGDFFAYEYNFIRWVERQNYSVTYFTDLDVHEGLLKKSRINALIIPGHGEYWTMNMRKAVDEKLKVNKIGLAVLSANVAYWQARVDEKIPGMLYCYKYNPDPITKTNPLLTTTQFRAKPVNMPEKNLFGMQYAGIPKPKYNDLTFKKHWLLKGTTLKPGDKIRYIIGGEVDAYDGTLPGVEIIGDSAINLYGKKTKSHVTWYRPPSGGKVFAAGTFYWNWFLDPYGKGFVASTNKNIQIITKNAINELIKSK
ncbi:N,N-dimethylformamidase beta subunit family domain-containing protein [Fictibacillus sp. S7]|uniref:N,N-dimethylformamidase beta subunit family domain-containing protein n=1 Tax=Fictibacillus sp. S7 TaxID=2212476 RepID=UPI001012A1DA|nr:N,N-dimethylformamidase beta subunit family domain-containing protein [Fictibacillus sp. S7]RXY98837.1 hypothetical protein DMO16_03605 [Fictibacillus sp. S7]